MGGASGPGPSAGAAELLGQTPLAGEMVECLLRRNVELFARLNVSTIRDLVMPHASARGDPPSVKAVLEVLKERLGLSPPGE